jgi:hypothetical protein
MRFTRPVPPTHPFRPSVSRSLFACCLFTLLVIVLAGCTTTVGGTESSGATHTALPTLTPTPQSPCVQLVNGATPFHSVSSVPGLQAPSGTYISPAATSGGGAGQYTVTSYTLCFLGKEADIDGGLLISTATPQSTVGYLVHNGWTPNNLFPDPTNFAYLDACSNSHVCVNSSGSGAPFAFVGFDQYASHSGGYTTVQLHVATIATPTCANDPQYYSGTPKYTLYNSAIPSNPVYHFLMPPATRVSTYLGGGTLGSTYAYFCSAGSQATIVAFLEQAMQNVGYAISNVTASGFSATTGNSPTYQIDVSVQSPSNYYLRIFVPM